MKKFLSTVLSIIMCICIFPFSVKAENTIRIVFESIDPVTAGVNNTRYGHFDDGSERYTVEMMPGNYLSDIPTPQSDSGYYFGGWVKFGNESDAFFTEEDLYGTVFTEDTIFYSIWSEDSNAGSNYFTPIYTVSFDAVKPGYTVSAGNTDTGLLNYEFQVKKGNEIIKNLYVVPADNHDTFTGWIMSGTDTRYTPEQLETFKPEQDTVFTAEYDTRYTVTIDANGGYFDDNTDSYIYSDEFRPGDIGLHDLKIPKKANRLFDGWSTQKDIYASQVNPDEFTCNDDATLYALWKKGATVTLHACGKGEINGSEIYEFAVPADGSPVTYPTLITYTGYAFKYWADAPENYGTIFYSLEDQNFFEDIHLYAQYDNAAEVTLDLNGGNVKGKPDETAPFIYTVVEEHNAGEYEIPTFEKDHARFGGWTTVKDDLSTSIDLEAYYPESDVTLYAYWIETVTLKLHAGEEGYYDIIYDGEGNPVEYVHDLNKEVDKGSSISIPKPINDSRNSFLYYTFSEDGSGEQINPRSITAEEDMELYAQWTFRPKVVFDANGGLFSDNTTSKNYYYESGAMISYRYPKDPQKEGKGFAGWTTVKDDASTLVDQISYYVVNEDVTLYALWDVAYAVTLHTGGHAYLDNDPDVFVKTIYVTRGKTLPYVNLSTEDEHFSFRGFWNTKEDGTGESVYPGEFIPEGDIDLYAQYNQYLVYYLDPNGGRCLEWMEVGKVQTALVNIEEITPGIPENLGRFTHDGDYVCTGLTTVKDDPSTLIDLETFVVTDGLVLYAYWTEATVVVLDPQDGYFSWMPNNGRLKCLPGDSVLLNYDPVSNDPTQVFWCWNTEADGSGTNIMRGTRFTPEGNCTLYAKYIPGYRVTFDANGFSFSGGKAEIIYYIRPGERLNYREIGLGSDEYAFDSWNTEQDGSGMKIEINEIYDLIPEGDMTLYCQYVPRFTITLDANGGVFTGGPEVYTVQTVPTGIGQYPDAMYYPIWQTDELVFAGYNTRQDGSGDFYYAKDLQETVITEDMTFYAIYAEPVTITFDSGDDLEFDSPSENTRNQVYPKGYIIQSYPYPRESLTRRFTGYGTVKDDPSSMIDLDTYIAETDVTMYAFAEDYYHVEFYPNGGYFEDGSFNTAYNLNPGEPIGITVASLNSGRERYVFDCWNTEVDGSGISIANEEISTYVPTGPMDLYAIWVYQEDLQEISVDSLILMEAGEGKDIPVKTIPDKAYVQTASYTSDDPSVAMIDENGNITAVGPGYATITINMDGKTAECRIKVRAQGEEPTLSIPVTVTSYDETPTTVSAVSPGLTYEQIRAMVAGGNTEDVETQLEDRTTEGDEVTDTLAINEMNADVQTVVFYKKGYLPKVVEVKDEEPIDVTLRMLGDASNDGEVNVVDLVAARNEILGNTSAEGEDYYAMDINYDDKINIIDLVQVRNRILGVTDMYYE